MTPHHNTPPIPGPNGPVLRRLTRDDILTVTEVADLLHLPVSTIYRLARQGQLPATRLGRTWRFLRPELEQLLTN